MRKLFYFAAIVIIILSGCNNKTGSKGVPNKSVISKDSLVMPYEDNLLSLLLPQGWTWETDTCETWQIRNIVDSLKITSGVVEFFPPDNSFKIRIVKGATRWLAPNNPVEDWATMIFMRADVDSTCIYISDISDSLQVNGHDACKVWTAYDFDGDTIIQDQFIVIKDKYDLYYLSGVFDYGDNESAKLWHKILTTVKLK